MPTSRTPLLSSVLSILTACASQGVGALAAEPIERDLCDEDAARESHLAAMRALEGDAIVLSYGSSFDDYEDVARRVEEAIPGARAIPTAVFEATLLGPAGHGTQPLQAVPSDAIAELSRYVVRGSLDRLAAGERAVALGVDIAAYLGVDVGDTLGVVAVADESRPVDSRRRTTLRVAAILHLPGGRALHLDSHYAVVPLERADELGSTGISALRVHTPRASEGAITRLAEVLGGPYRVVPFEELHQRLLDDVAIRWWCGRRRGG